MGLYKKLDMWSVMDGLQEIMDYEYFGEEKENQYWDYYCDQIREMGILASDMWNEIEEVKYRIWRQMPYKGIEFCSEDDCTQTAVAWWNTAACMLSDTDMAVLLENENVYDFDIAREKEKRIRALERLTKKQQMLLYTEVIGFITRYLELMAAFETVTAAIRELEYHQSFVIGRDGVVVPDGAYV